LIGFLLSKLGRTDEAIDHLRQALIFKQDAASTHTALGIALSEARQFPEAVEHFRKVADLNPSDAGAHSNLGLALAKNGQYDEAITQLKLAAADSGERSVLKLLATLVAEQVNREEARLYLERAAHLDPPEADAWVELGSNYALCKEPEKAIECYRRALSIEEDNPRTQEFLGASLSDIGHWEEAEIPMRRALELAPANARIQMNLGAVLANLGRMEEARELQRRALELDPTILADRDDPE
jgi:Flp pilus assembly protein TadD